MHQLFIMRMIKTCLLATAFSLAALSGCGEADSQSDTQSDTQANGERAAIPAKTGSEHIGADGGYARYADDAAVSEQALKDVIAPFFDDPAQSETRGVVILHGGILVAERYAPGFMPDTPLISWSMAKTITAALVGMMVADGRLSLDARAPVEEWHTPGDPRAKITLRHLLHMASGLDHSEGPSEENGKALYEADTMRMLFLEDGRDDVARYAETRILEAEPGTQFEYSTATSQILSDIITRTLTDSQNPQVRKNATLQFARGRLFEPLGMDSMVPEFDRSGTMLGGAVLHGTPRDWAKMGEFLRNHGSVRGAQLLPHSWVRFMRSPSEHDAAYGGHMWLNRPRPAERNQVLFPGKAPEDVFALLGHLGQFVVISPRHKLVIVRMGKTNDDEMDAVNDQLARVINLFPESK